MIRAALAHVQFETIHPFLDGKGRVGRLLITFLLCRARILREPLLYLSLYFKQSRAEYYRLLDMVRTEGDWEAWITFSLEGVLQTGESAVNTARRLAAMFSEDQARIRPAGRRAGSGEGREQPPGVVRQGRPKPFRWRQDEGRTNATINRDLAHLHHMMNDAVTLDLSKENKVSKVDRLPEIRRFRPRPTDSQIDGLLAGADTRIRPILGFIRETGCRPNEAPTPKHSQILRDEELVVFTDHTKSGKFRVVPITEECRAWIDQMPRLPDCPFVFYNTHNGRPWKNCRKLINDAIQALGSPWLRPKGLRRHYAITLSENGAEMHVIQSMLGHSSVRTTETYYAHFSPNFAARRARQLLDGRRANSRERGTPDGTQTGRMPPESDAA